MASILDRLRWIRLQIQRVISAVALVIGIAILWSWYPGGDGGFVLPFLGGLFALLGLVGVIDPARVIPTGGGHAD